MAGRASLSIAEVARATGIPAPTLRVYEREIPSLFPIARTPGGHRRYSADDLEHFSLLRRLTGEQALPFARVRAMFEKEAGTESTARVARLEAAIQALENRVAELEAGVADTQESDTEENSGSILAILFSMANTPTVLVLSIFVIGGLLVSIFWRVRRSKS